MCVTTFSKVRVETDARNFVQQKSNGLSFPSYYQLSADFFTYTYRLFSQTNADTQKQKQAKTRAGGKVVEEDDDEEEEALRSLLSLMILVFSG